MPPATANSQHGLLWVSLAAFLWIYADAVFLTFQSMVRLSFPDLLIFHQHATAVSPRSHGHSDGELTFGSHTNIQCQSPEPIQSSHVVLESCQTISSNNAIKCNKNKLNTTKPWSPKPCADPWFQLSASRTSWISECPVPTWAHMISLNFQEHSLSQVAPAIAHAIGRSKLLMIQRDEIWHEHSVKAISAIHLYI